MPDERDIHRSRRAELEAVVGEHGTEAEAVELTWSGMR
jgi:hypothetical protein